MLTEINDYHIRFFIDEEDRRQGEYIQWYNNGKIELQKFYVDNKLHGEYKEWFDDGQVWINCFYKNGKYHGEYRRYYGNGQIYKHCFYVNGIETSFDELPLPNTPEDRMYFKLKYDLLLLTVENKC